ncbi:uncharacterized protein TNCV_1299561 [Trichonephila clavipes]|nr:uncharacterized protein TNCV_1299561 [Trichonephila clavipes]
MKTSSVEFISRSPTPSPMERKYRRFVLLRRIFQPWQWKRRKKRNRFEQTSRTLQRKKIQPKINLLKKCSYAGETQCLPWNLPDVERCLHMMEKLLKILLWSPWKYRCGQRTVRLAVVACSQKQRSLRAQAHQSKSRTETCELVKVKLKLLDIRAEKKSREKRRERERKEIAKYSWFQEKVHRIEVRKMDVRLYMVAAVVEWYRYRIVACLVTSSSPVPLKTRRVGQQSTLNLSRAETSSHRCSVVVRRVGASSGVVHVT